MKKEIPFPTMVDLALTGKCNLRCKHCNTSDTWGLDNELSLGEIKVLLDQLEEEKIFNLMLFGGEPFCHPRIFESLDLIDKYPMRVTILTNGTLIDEGAVKRLSRMKFLQNVQVSIDGSSAGIHDWQRGDGSFKRAIRAVKLMLKGGVPVNIKAIINAHNYDDIGNMVELARKLGLGGMDFGDAVECGRAASFADKMRFESRVHRSIMLTMFRLRKNYGGFHFGGTLAQKMEMLEDFYLKGPGKGSRGTFSTCPAGHSTLSIRSDGKVVPCSALWTLVCGDARKQSLRKIWKSSPVFRKLRAIAREKLTRHNPSCQKCDYLSFCNGGCRASAYYVSGMDLRGFDPSNCAVFSGTHGFRVPKNLVLSSRS